MSAERKYRLRNDEGQLLVKSGGRGESRKDNEDRNIGGSRDIERIVVVESEAKEVPGRDVEFQEYLSTSAESVDAIYYDGGSDVVFPRLNMSPDEVDEFVVGLRGISQQLAAKYGPESTVPERTGE